MKGNGTIDVSGGNGSAILSGGGSAGRVSIRFWLADKFKMYPDMTSDWKGNLIKTGGLGYQTGDYGDGSDGTLFTSK